jgi:chemotaxis protein CheX
MLPDDEVLAEITRSVWDAMLSMELKGPIDQVPAASLWCAVDISGSWKGTVWLGLSPEHASAVTQVMLELAPGAESEADAREVAAELANMLGGNIKGILQGQNRLSLPRVGAPGEAMPERSKRLHFESGRGTFSVAVCEGGDGVP